MTFERDIAWLQCSETRVEFRHGGRVLRVQATYNDFYGYLTSADPHELNLARLTASFEITEQSSLELVAVTTVMLTPAIEIPASTTGAGQKQEWGCVPEDWRREVKDADDTPRWPRLEQVVLAREITWTSKGNEATNAALRAALAQRFPVPASVASSLPLAAVATEPLEEEAL